MYDYLPVDAFRSEAAWDEVAKAAWDEAWDAHQYSYEQWDWEQRCRKQAETHGWDILWDDEDMWPTDEDCPWPQLHGEGSVGTNDEGPTWVPEPDPALEMDERLEANEEEAVPHAPRSYRAPLTGPRGERLDEHYDCWCGQNADAPVHLKKVASETTMTFAQGLAYGYWSGLVDARSLLNKACDMLGRFHWDLRGWDSYINDNTWLLLEEMEDFCDRVDNYRPPKGLNLVCAILAHDDGRIVVVPDGEQS